MNSARAPRLLTATGAGLLLALAATPAVAGPPQKDDKERFVFDESFVDEHFCGDFDEETGEPFGGFPVLISEDVTGWVRTSERKSGRMDVRGTVRGTISFTNEATGESVTSRFTSNFKYTEKVVDGTLTLRSQNAGNQRSFDEDGKLLARDAGLFRFTLVVEDVGTPQERVVLDEVKSAGPKQSEGLDLCALLA